VSKITEFTLLRMFEDLKTDEIRSADLQLASQNLLPIMKSKDGSFSSNASVVTESIDKMIDDEPSFRLVFPDGNYKFFKSEIGRLYKKYDNIDIFAKDFDSDIIFLEKAQVGKTTKQDIFNSISEYERRFNAGFASPAEILTLYRFYPDRPEFQKAATEIPMEPMVIGGPASVAIVDKEGHLITTEALDEAFTNFMKNPRTNNLNVLHSDVQIGWGLPAYINRSGQVFKSGVDEKGLYFIAELRSDDFPVSNKVKEQIEKGKIRSYSIAGSALKVDEINTEDGKTVMRVKKLALAEITACEKGVNPGAHFDILKSHYHPETSCVDGSCLTTVGVKITGEKDGQPFVAEVMEVAEQTKNEDFGGEGFRPSGEVAMSGNEILKGSAVSKLEYWVQKNLKGNGFLLEDVLEGGYKKRQKFNEDQLKRIGMPKNDKKLIEETKLDSDKRYCEPGKVSTGGQLSTQKSSS